MARLTYTTQNGKAVSLPLEAETGFTAELVWFSPLMGKDTQDLRARLEGMGLPQLPGEGDHIIYGAPNGPRIIVFIRPRKASSAARAGQTQEPAGQNRQARQDGKLDLRRAAMLIHRSRREWIIVAEDAKQLRINNQPVPLLKILKDGMEIQMGDLTLTFSEADKETVDKKMRQALQGKKCPYCQSPFQAGEEIIRCPACGTVQHAECWEEYGARCSGPTGCPYGVKSPGAQKTQRSAT